MIYRVLIVLIALFMTLPAHSKKQKIKIRAATVAPEGTPWEAQLKRTKKHLRKDSGGRVKIKVFFGGQKGDEKSIVRQCRDGRLELIGVSTAALATEGPELQGLELPFIFDDYAESDFVLDNYLYDVVAKICLKYDFVMYQWAENGWQNIATKDGFVKKPADLVGRKMRSQEAPIHIATYRALGASPIEMAVSEVLPALKTGLVDGFAQTPLFTFAAGWHQAVKYYTITHHIYQPGIVVYSKKWFDTVPPDLQEVLLGDAEADAINSRKGVRRLEPGLLQNFRNYGIQIYELSKTERRQFAKAVKSVREDFERRASPDAIQLLKAIDDGKAAFAKKKGG